MNKGSAFRQSAGTCLSLVCLLSTVVSRAGAEDGTSASDAMELPIVLTASRVHQPLAEAPAAITVIDRDMIEASGVRQVADLLRLVPGAVVGYNDGNWPVATLRGLTGTYASGVQVLIDGVSVYSPIYGGMYWAELPVSLKDIERIEVVRGPNASSYGANSFQGVVNIITREPALVNRFSADANVGGGGIGDLEVHGVGGANNLRFRAMAGFRSDDGFDSRPDSMRWSFANLRGNYRIDAKNSIDASFRGGVKSKEYGEYASPARPNVTPSHDQTGNRVEMQARWSRAESSDQEWWVQVYHQSASQRDRYILDLSVLDPLLAPFAPLPFEIEQDFISERDGIEFQSVNTLSDSLRTVWGGEWRRDAARSARLFSTNEARTAFLGRGFGNFEWRVAPGWIVNAGAMFERNTLADNSWSPRVALIHEVAHGHTVRASFARAKRTPTMLEKYATESFTFPLPVPPFTINYPIYATTGSVKSESVSSQEVGYVFSFPDAALTGDLRWFSDRYTDLIAFRGRQDFISGADAVNIDRARINGTDVSLDWRPLEGTRIRVAAAHSGTDATDVGSQYSTSVPRSTLALMLMQTFGDGWSASANYQRVGEMFWVDAGQNKKSIPAIDHLNIRLAKKFRCGLQEVEVAGIVQNAFGHYRDYYLGTGQSSPTPDNVAKRLAYLQLSIDY